MAKENKTELTVSNQTVVRVIAMIALTFIGFQFISSISNILQLIFIAFFLSVALNPAVGLISRKLKLKSRVTATAISYLIVVALLVLMISYVFPPIVRQSSDFIAKLPQTIESAGQSDSGIGKLVQQYDLQAQFEGFVDDLKNRTADFSKPVISTASRVGSAFISIVAVLVLAFMMLVEGPIWKKRYLTLLPKKEHELHARLAQKMYKVVTGYVNGQVLLALIAAGFAFIVLVVASTVLDVSINAVALAGILIFTGLIPLIGNTIGGVVVVLSSLLVSLPLALIMAIFFIVYQQIENVTLQPYIQAKYNELSPLLVFVAALLGVNVAGFLGALVAIPLAGCAKVLLLEFLDYRKKQT